MNPPVALEAIRPDESVGEPGQALAGLPMPEPVPDLHAYLRERRIRLSRSPEALANYLAFMASERRSVEVDYLPIRLDFENVSRCNFRCTMCTVSEWPKGRRAADMALADFERLLDEQVGLVEVKVQGLGEPTMQGDDYFAMIRLARSRHIWVRTTTNASLLHLKDNHRKLLDSGVNEIQISIDGADAEVFQAIRRGAVFDRVIANCRLINDTCDAEGVERTKMWTVVQRGNRHQLADLVRLGARIGFRHMAFSLNLVDFGLAEWRIRNDAVTVEREFGRAEAEDLMALGAEHGIDVRFWSVAHKYSTAEPSRLCPWPFERAAISSDLRVVPCCIIGNPDVSELGSAAKGFSEVWFGDAHAEFRRAHLEGRIPAVCRSCYEDGTT